MALQEGKQREAMSVDNLRMEFLEEAVSILLKGHVGDMSNFEAIERIGRDIEWGGRMIMEQYHLRQTDGVLKRTNDELKRIASSAKELATAICEASPETFARLVLIRLEKSERDYGAADFFAFAEKCASLYHMADKRIVENKYTGRPRATHQLLSVLFLCEIFEKHRPGEATTYDDGDFAQFCEVMFQMYSKEREPDLSRAIKNAVKVKRNIDRREKGQNPSPDG
jgi:hypothetical protein